MDILAGEQVSIDRLTGHGGLFKTPVVGQKYLAAACNAPITCMETAGEGGPYGMALLAAYMYHRDKSLEAFLSDEVFQITRSVTISLDEETAAGFYTYLEKYKANLPVERLAAETRI